jgi:hypothetical protein
LVVLIWNKDRELRLKAALQLAKGFEYLAPYRYLALFKSITTAFFGQMPDHLHRQGPEQCILSPSAHHQYLRTI